MNTILLVDKGGSVNETKIKNYCDDELFKKCKFKNNENFSLKTKWKVKKYKFKYVELWGKNKGRAGQENKYDFPPPVDKDLYFGNCCLVGKDDENNIQDIKLEEWDAIYENLFGGFEDLKNTALLDELEHDELDDVPDNMKTKSGYLKDDFIVDDDEEIEQEEEDQESDSFDNASELSLEEYTYAESD